MIKECEWCGKLYDTNDYVSKVNVCSDECKYNRSLKIKRINWAKLQERKRTLKEKKNQDLIKVNEIARENKMTYGQYVALQTKEMIREGKL